MVEDETALLQRFSHSDDPQAFAELVRRFTRLVYGTSYRILRDRSDAADITQETFLALCQQADRISGSLSAWLHRVATNKAFDLIRRQRRCRQREEAYAETRSAEIRTWQTLSSQIETSGFNALRRMPKTSQTSLTCIASAYRSRYKTCGLRGILCW